MIRPETPEPAEPPTGIRKFLTERLDALEQSLGYYTEQISGHAHQISEVKDALAELDRLEAAERALQQGSVGP